MPDATASTIPRSDVEAILAGSHRDPFSVLGPHAATRDGKSGVAIRAFVPGTLEAWVLHSGQALPMRRVDAEGLFEAWLEGARLPLSYRLRFRGTEDQLFEMEDTFRFPQVLTDFDLHLLGEGTHYQNYERLGSHPRVVDGVAGVSFAVWAPNADRVSVVGDFNFWDGRRHPMRLHPGVGIWDIFVPEIGAGTKYKYEIVGPGGRLLPLKSDPYGFFFEVRPKTASIVHDIDQYRWNDQNWMRDRRNVNALDAPIAIYEVHLGSWIRDPADPERLLSYAELAERLAKYVLELGFTHIELLPISEHPFDGSWGYQTLGYFAPTSRHGTPEDFMAFVDYMHQKGIGIVVDWVPAHFPRDDHGLRLFDGTALYDHADPRQGEHPDWGTLVFNYGRNEVANFLLGNALFWFEKYHIDGIRVDAVASMLYLDYGRHYGEWIPNRYGGNENLEAIDFLKRLNELVHLRHPGVLTIAEESTAWGGVSRPTYVGGLGFSLKWNMGWMNDTLRYMHKDPVYRKYHQNDLTFSLVYAFSENFILPLSHDEVVHGKGALLDKMPGDYKQHFANLRLLLGYMYGHPGKKLLFMGGEFGQWVEWRSHQSLDWHLLEYEPHQGVQLFVRDLNRLLATEPALYQIDFEHTGFQWIDFHDSDSSTIAFLRKSKPGAGTGGAGQLSESHAAGDDAESILLFLCNFTPVVRERYRVGVPREGFYRELLNSDAQPYGGGNIGNSGGVWAQKRTCHDQPYSIEVTLPPLGVLVFKPFPSD